jgi:hypothetical protein
MQIIKWKMYKKITSARWIGIPHMHPYKCAGPVSTFEDHNWADCHTKGPRLGVLGLLPIPPIPGFFGGGISKGPKLLAGK